eukprot:Awhi_evm1s1549
MKKENKNLHRNFSYHVPRSAMRTDWDSLKSQFDKANANGSVDVVKVVAKATEFDDGMSYSSDRIINEPSSQ